MLRIRKAQLQRSRMVLQLSMTTTGVEGSAVYAEVRDDQLGPAISSLRPWPVRCSGIDTFH